MIRLSHVIFGVLLGASDIHPAGQYVTMGGVEWYQPGNQTFYRSPDIVTPHSPSAPAPSHKETCKISRKGIARALRHEAWRVEHNSSQSEDNRVANTLQRAIEQLNDKKKEPGTNDCWNNEVPH